MPDVNNYASYQIQATSADKGAVRNREFVGEPND